MKKQHYRLPFWLSILITLCCFQLNAQSVKDMPAQHIAYTEEFVHHARELFDWKTIDEEFQRRLQITPEQSNLFFLYIAKKNYVNMVPYLEKVKDGSITVANATAYWMDRLSVFEKLYL